MTGKRQWTAGSLTQAHNAIYAHIFSLMVLDSVVFISLHDTCQPTSPPLTDRILLLPTFIVREMKIWQVSISE